MKKLNNRQNQVKSLDFTNNQAFIFKDTKHQVSTNIALNGSEKQQSQKSPQLIKGLIMGQSAINNKAAPQKSEINHYNKKYQGQTITNIIPSQHNMGKMAGGVTLSYAESSQSFKPSPVKSEGINTKNFPLSIQKTQTHKAQKIKIGLHKKAASLMNSNQISSHNSAIADNTQFHHHQIIDLGKNLQINQPLKTKKSQGGVIIQSTGSSMISGVNVDKQQSVIMSKQTSFNEYMSSNNDIRQNQYIQSQYGANPKFDNFINSTQQYTKNIHDSQLSNEQFNNTSTMSQQQLAQRYNAGFINTMSSNDLVQNQMGIKSYDQRSALGQIINSNQQSSQRMSLIGNTNILASDINIIQTQPNKMQAYRSHTNSFKNSSQVAMKHPQSKYIKGVQSNNVSTFEDQQLLQQSIKQKKTLQNYHQRTLSDTSNQQYLGQSSQMFFNHQNMLASGQISNRQQFQELIRSVNDKEASIIVGNNAVMHQDQNTVLINTMPFSSTEDIGVAGIAGLSGISSGQHLNQQTGFTMNQPNNFNPKTTLGSSRQSVQSSTHLDDRDAIIHHYKNKSGKGQSSSTNASNVGQGGKSQYSELKTIYNGMLRDQMQKTKQALKLTQQQFGGPSRKVVNNNRALNANTQSYRAANYVNMSQGNQNTINIASNTIVGSSTLLSTKMSRGDVAVNNKSTPKVSNNKKVKPTSKQTIQYGHNTSSQGNRSSNNTTQVTQHTSGDKMKKKTNQTNFLVTGLMNSTHTNLGLQGSIVQQQHLGHTTDGFKRMSGTSTGYNNQTNILMMNQLGSNKNGQKIIQQQSIVHKRSQSDGNSTFLGMHKAAQSSKVSQLEDSKDINNKLNTMIGSIVAGGNSAPISELSNIPDSRGTIQQKTSYSKKQSHQSSSLMNNEYEWVNAKNKNKQQLHQSEIMSMESNSLINTERQQLGGKINHQSINQINSQRYVMNGGAGGGHQRHNSQLVAVDSNNKINFNGSSIPQSTKKVSGDASKSNGSKKIHEMMIEDQAMAGQKPKNNSKYLTDNKQKQATAINEFHISEQKKDNHISLQPQLKVVEERIETQDSAMSDPNLSPRTKMQSKLSRKVKLAFTKTNNPPATSADFYKIGKVMGKGAFGKVNLAVHRLSEKFVALKSINKQFLNEEASKRKVMQEFNILRRTRHKNVVRLYESFETQQHIVFVMEVCGAGDLLTYVRRRRKLKEDVAKHVFKQIIEGLKYCHSKNILHRDIKLDNILLTSEGDVKICDFGVSKLVRNGEVMTEQCGTPAYIAPEVFENKGYENYASDVWSAGVVLYAMLYGTVPFKASNMSELQKQITKCQTTFKEEISPESLNLLKSILEKDPSKRMSINDILKHPWMQDIPENVTVFSDQEKEKINSEFAYYNFKNDLGNTQEIVHTDPFTEQMLNSTQNSLVKNVSTKSVILAPFNSTRTHIDETMHMHQSIQDLLVDKKFIKFAPKVKEINRQYELNNNAELDNGVYHQEDEEEEKKEKKGNSLETSFDKQDNSDIEDEKIGDDKKLQNEIEEGQKRKKQSEWQKIEQMMIDKQKNEEEEDDNNYAKFDSTKSMYGGVGSAMTLVINEQIVQEVEKSGYPRGYIVSSLNNDELNHATTFYYLLTTSKEY